jgi:hypothetical protein
MLFSLSEFELLRGTNAVSCQRGGCWVGNVGAVHAWTGEDGEVEADATGGTYRNQWVVSVELHDDAAPFGGDVAPGDHEWRVRTGFCQTSIQRAPNGGWSLELPKELVAMAPTVGHLQDLWGCQLGKSDERQAKLDRWLQSVQSWRENHQVFLLDMNALVREAALDYSMERALIE